MHESQEKTIEQGNDVPQLDTTQSKETPPSWDVEKPSPLTEPTSTVPIQHHHEDPSKVPHGEDLEKAHSAAPSEPLFSVFPRHQKLFIVVMGAIGSFFSPFSTSVYFPALNTLSAHYNVSTNLINLSITTYMIFQAISPMLYADLADQNGRRPAIISTFLIYVAANIGLATQNSYAALMVLRCLQSAGSSATIALGMAIIADIATAAERGSYMGWSTSFVLFAPAIAPIIGGALTQTLGWRSIFWLLVIMSGTYITLFILFIPETNRRLVGNGSIPPARWWNKSGVTLIKEITCRGKVVEKEDSQTQVQASTPKKSRWPRPWKVLAIIKEKDVVICLAFTAIMNGAFYTVMATVPTLFGPIWGLDDLEIGLCYLPLGAGTCLSAIANGKLLDYNYARVAKANNLPTDRKRGQDLRNFPIEKARLGTTWLALLPGVLSIVCYGWALQYSKSKAALAGALILQFIIGASVVATMNSMSTLLIDLYPDRAASVTASNNLIRCLVGAGATAVINPMIEAMGLGWSYTFWGLLLLAFSPFIFVSMKFGPKWREQRYLRDEKAKDMKQGSL